MDRADAAREDATEPDDDLGEPPEQQPMSPLVSRNSVRGGTVGGSLFQIAQWHGDLNSETPTGPPAELASAAPRRPSLFLGRDQELESVLTTSNPVCVVAGMGGAGKTTLALEAAYRLREQQDYSGGLLFLDCRGYLGSDRRDHEAPMELAQVTSSLLHWLGVHDAPQAEAATKRLQQRYEEFAEKGLPLLLVLDDLGTRFDPEPLLPASQVHRTLITTRDADLVRDAALIRLPKMSSGAAAELLRAELERAAPDDPRARDSDGLHEVAELCGRLPLALSVIAAMLGRSPKRELSAVAAQLATSQRLTVLDSVRSAFELSVTTLRESPAETDREAAVLFQRMGCLPGSEFTDRSAAALLDEPDPARAWALLDRLCTAHLLAPGGHSDQVRFPDLAGEYASKLFGELPSGQDAEARNGSTLSQLDVLVRLAESAASSTRDDMSAVDSSEDAQAVAQAFQRLAAEHDALWTLTARAADTAEREPEPPDTGARRRLLAASRTIAVSLVVLYERTGRGRESLATSRLLLRVTRALDDRRGEFDAFLAMCRGLLAVDARTEAAQCLHEASKLTRQLDGYPAEFMRTFAELACEVGELAAGADEYTGLLDRYRRSGDVEGQLAALSGLGRVAFLRDDLPEAVRRHEEARDLAQRHAFAPHAERALNELGECHARLGDTARAARCHRDAKRSAERRGFPHGSAVSSHHLGDLHHEQGEDAEALECYAESERRYREAGDAARADRLVELIHAMRTGPERPAVPADPPLPVEPPPIASAPQRDPSTVVRSMLDVLVGLVVLTAAQLWSAREGAPSVPWTWWALVVLLLAMAVARRYAYRFTTIGLSHWSWALDVLAYAAVLGYFAWTALNAEQANAVLGIVVLLLSGGVTGFVLLRRQPR
ncbi:tetratricopeptide repeat protein [Saccharopolyspora sp. NFXS83]|uniref:tetratricopeptide repeat protein n=1 Tax=Saccharopolyspora sp. NFXS83 TaxID=2993560 RepID=UPI00224AD333|nr:tetratricopeptide repeat protein [Saccharopolyspora sp. NFXS83]MCX2732964.1 tetratricopeptide repeat protein [Saccharopolyspora sp. NFXS83]